MVPNIKAPLFINYECVTELFLAHFLSVTSEIVIGKALDNVLLFEQVNV